MALRNTSQVGGHIGRVSAAFACLNRWLQDDTLLFWAYTLLLSGCVVARFQEVAQYWFLWVVIPLVFLSAVQLDASRAPPEVSVSVRLSLSRVLRSRNSISIILCAAGLYLLMLILSSALQKPTLGRDIFISLLVVSLEIMGFLLVTALLILPSKGSLNRCLTVITVVAAANALTAIIIFVASTPFSELFLDRLGDAAWPPGGRLGVATLAINSGIFLAASIAILLEDGRSLWSRIPLAASAVILACALLLSQSRSICLAAVAGIAASCRWSWRSIAAVGIAGTLLLALIFTSVPSVREEVLRRGDSRRPEIWSHYINLAWDRPGLGYGVIKDIRFKAKDGLLIVHAHDLVLSAEVRGGMLAAGAMIVILLGGLYYAARYAKLTGQRAPLGMMVTLVVAGLSDYEILAEQFPDWQTIPFWFPVGICIGTELYVRSRRNGVASTGIERTVPDPEVLQLETLAVARSTAGPGPLERSRHSRVRIKLPWPEQGGKIEEN